MFQYAGTVEQATWNDEQQKKELEVRGYLTVVLASVSKTENYLQQRLAGLSRDSSHKKREDFPPPTTAAPIIPSPSTSPAKPRMSPTLSPKRKKYHAPSKTYTIVQQEQEDVDRYNHWRPANAPYVLSASMSALLCMLNYVQAESMVVKGARSCQTSCAGQVVRGRTIRSRWQSTFDRD